MPKLSKRQMEVYEELKNAPEAKTQNGKITNAYWETYRNPDGSVNYQYPKGWQGNFKNRTLLAIERAGLIEIVNDTDVIVKQVAQAHH